VAWLAELGVIAELLEPGVPMPTVELAAAAIGALPEQIVKTLLFRGRDGQLARVIASGPRRIDREKLVAITGLDRPKLAPPEIVLEATGWPAGGVAPVGSPQPIPTYIDESVMEWDFVFGGGGTELTLIRIGPADILRLTRASVARIVETPPIPQHDTTSPSQGAQIAP
jgi:prolyl-tRNA editing enzyme YbaK/EbsC (Cys-tRNA(Pro) deacylase)